MVSLKRVCKHEVMYLQSIARIPKLYFSDLTTTRPYCNIFWQGGYLVCSLWEYFVIREPRHFEMAWGYRDCQLEILGLRHLNETCSGLYNMRSIFYHCFLVKVIFFHIVFLVACFISSCLLPAASLGILVVLLRWLWYENNHTGSTDTAVDPTPGILSDSSVRQLYDVK